MKTIPAILWVLALFALICQASCVTRKKVNAYLWLNNSPIPQEICEREPDLKDYGLYRKLNGGGFEFVSFCEVKARDFFSMYKTDFERLLNGKQESEGSKPRKD